jgi:hypothetical protein
MRKLQKVVRKVGSGVQRHYFSDTKKEITLAWAQLEKALKGSG